MGRNIATRIVVGVVVAIVITVLRTSGALGATLETAYGEATTDVTITAATCCTWYEIVSTGAVAYDGSTVVMMEAYVPQADLAGGSPLRWSLFEDGSMLGDALGIANNTGNTRLPLTFKKRFTPSSGTHTYALRASTTNNNSVMRCNVSAVQGIQMTPCYIRITLANPTLDSGGGGASELSDLTDVDTAGVANNDVLKWDSTESLWKPEADATGSGSGGTVALSSDDRDRLDLVWWGTWALVGLLFALMLAPRWFAAFRVTRGW